MNNNSCKSNTSSQQESEINMVCSVLNYMGILLKEGDLRLGEDPPDCVASIKNNDVGIEVAEYHKSKNIGEKYVQRSVENQWEKLQNKIYAIQKQHKIMQTVTGYLSFKNIPSDKNIDDFISDLVSFVLKNNSHINEGALELSDFESFSELGEWLGYLTLFRTRYAQVQFNSNITGGFIGIDDEQLLKCIHKKTSQNYAANNVLPMWLLIFSGYRTSQHIGLPSAEKLNKFYKSNAAFNGSNFNKVLLYQEIGQQLFIKNKNCGWEYIEKKSNLD